MAQILSPVALFWARSSPRVHDQFVAWGPLYDLLYRLQWHEVAPPFNLELLSPNLIFCQKEKNEIPSLNIKVVIPLNCKLVPKMCYLNQVSVWWRFLLVWLFGSFCFLEFWPMDNIPTRFWFYRVAFVFWSAHISTLFWLSTRLCKREFHSSL